MANQWYLQTKSGRQGPFSDQELIQMVQEGNVSRGSLLRREGDQSWHRAENIGGLFSRLPVESMSQVVPSEKGMTPRTLPPPLPVKEQGSNRLRRSPSKKRQRYWIISSVLGFLLVGLFLLVVVRPDLVTFPEKLVTSSPESAETGTDKSETASDDSSSSKEDTETSRASKESDQETASIEMPGKFVEQKTDPKRESSELGFEKKSVENRSSSKEEESASSPQMPTDVLVEKSSPSVAIILGNYNSGSGFMVSQNVLATNRHVIEYSVDDDLKIYFPSQSNEKKGPYQARLLYEDPKRDLAFLNVKCDISQLPLAENYQFKSGQEIIAIGSPGARAAKFELVPNAVNKGILSAEVELKDDQKYYQMGISINHGNSGGPVLNLSGFVVGVATAGEAGDHEQLTYCIPVGQLIDSKESAIRRSATEVDHSRSNHRAQVIYLTAKNAGHYYTMVFDIYKKTAIDAVAANENQKSALQVAKLLIDKQLPLPSDADISVIQKHITSATSDALIPDKTKSAMTDLLANVREMKRIADHPEQRSLQSLIDKLIDLTDRQTELSKKMRIALNISEP